MIIINESGFSDANSGSIDMNRTVSWLILDLPRATCVSCPARCLVRTSTQTGWRRETCRYRIFYKYGSYY